MSFDADGDEYLDYVKVSIPLEQGNVFRQIKQ